MAGKRKDENKELVKVILNVSDDTFGVTGERVWASKVGDDLYEIRNTPWHTCEIGWGDIVRALAPNEKEWPRMVELVRPSGHRTLHVFFFNEASESYRSEVLGKLKDWKANYENADGKLYAVDIQPEGDFDGLCAYLDRLDTSKVDYRTIVTPIKPDSGTIQ